MAEKILLALSTFPDADTARRISNELVTKKFAACANIVPRVESIYRWQGKVESSREWLLLIKTTVEKFTAVRDAIRDLHSYELPECIAIAVDDGSSSYLQWIADSLVDATKSR